MSTHSRHPEYGTADTNRGRDDGPLPASQPDESLAPPAVQVRSLRKSFRKDGAPVDVIRDLDLEVADGEFVSIIGRSGCGKSTLLKILAGLTSYRSGDVIVGGKKVSEPRSDVGFVFQHLALLPWRTVLGNVLLPAELERRDRSEHKQRAAECLEMVGLDGYERYYPREISGGMQQRVALARVLMSQSRLLLLDEPFSALDELTRESLNTLFLELCASTRITSLLVTHSIVEAVWMSDRVLVMPASANENAKWVGVRISRPRSAKQMRSDAFNDTVADVRTALGMDT